MSTQQELNQKMSALVDAINTAVAEAEAFADEHGLEFTLDIAYGMGGTYVSEKAAEGWSFSAGWMPSSQSC
jgi:hypothetical protein